MAQAYDPETGTWREDGQPDPFARPVQPAPASTPPPLYPGAAASNYTDWNGQSQTVPTTPTPPNGPVSSIDQPMWKDLWAQSGQNPQAFVQAVIGQLGLHGRQTDPTAINTVLRALQAVGVNATLDQRSDQYHKGIMLNGQFVRLLDGSDHWTWQPGGGASSSGGGPPVTIDPSYLSPFTKPVPNYTAPPAFNYADFKAPAASDVFNDPGYQFRLDQGRKTIETAASAKGLLNSGGNLSDLLGFGQQMGSQEFQNVFNRARDTYATNRSNAADIYRTNYDSQYVDPFARQLQTFDRAQDLYFRNQQAPWDKIMGAARLGVDAAGA